MARNSLIQMREFGVHGWNKLLPTLLLCDRVDTLIPSGADLKKANELQLCQFSEAGFIELIKAGVVRVGARPENIVGNTGKKAFFGPEEGMLGNFLKREYEAGSNYLVVHPEYDDARIALEEIVNYRNADSSSRYAIARQCAEKHLDGNYSLPPFMVERANQFGSLPLNEIIPGPFRDCMQFIRAIPNEREREILLLCSQVIRIAVVHDRFMQRHGCDIIFGYQDYASLVRSVAKAEPYKPPPHGPLQGTVEQIIALIDFLLALEPIKNFQDFWERREKLQAHRAAIWRLACYNDAIDEYLRERISDIVPIGEFFGSTGVGREISIVSWLLSGISALIEGLPISGILSNLLAVASGVESVKAAERNRLESDATWLGVLVYNVEKPTREQMKKIRDDLEYHIIKRRAD